MKRQQLSVLLAGLLALSQLAACSSIGWKGFGIGPAATPAPAPVATAPAASTSSASAGTATTAAIANAPAITGVTASADDKAGADGNEPSGQN